MGLVWGGEWGGGVPLGGGALSHIETALNVLIE